MCNGLVVNNIKSSQAISMSCSSQACFSVIFLGKNEEQDNMACLLDDDGRSLPTDFYIDWVKE